MFSNSTMRFLEELEEEHNDRPWGDVIAGSLIINLVTFSGVILTSAVGCFHRMRKGKGDITAFWSMMHRIAIPSFAGGALLATCVFLLIPEAFKLLEHADEEEADHYYNSTTEMDGEVHEEDDHSEHKEEAQWRFGISLLIGFLFPVLIGTIFSSPDTSACEECNEQEIEEASALSQSAIEASALEGVKEEKVEESLVKEVKTITSQHHQASKINWGLATSILLGDGFHNFVDGIFLGNAFVLCSRDIAYTMVATTIYHELAQEISDFFLFTHHCGMSTRQALTFNFLSGFSVMAGALLIVALELSEKLTGGLLSVSAGVYIYIAATECIPRIQAARKDANDTLVFLMCFIIGAVPIGLVLLNHGHCEAEEDDHSDHRLLL
jgi:zinc transporter ZupT